MIVQTREQFDEVLQTLQTLSRVAVDIESRWTEAWDFKKLIGIGFWAPELSDGAYFPFRHVFGGLDFGERNLPMKWLAEFQNILGRTDLETVWWNAKTDMNWLRKDNLEVVGPITDGMVLSHMSCEWAPHKLKVRGKQLLGIDADFEQKKIKDLQKITGAWEAIPPLVMGTYCIKDCKLTWELNTILMQQLVDQDLDHLVPEQMEYLRCLQDLEWHGLKIDQTRAESLSNMAGARIEELLTQLDYDPAKPLQLANRLYSDKPEGLGLTVGLLGKPSRSFPKGRPVMDRPTLQCYQLPEVESILEYRSLVKAKGTWFDAFRECSDGAGRIHTSYWQHGTVTTRLSCRRPSLHQLPRMKDEEEEQGVTQKLVKKMISCDEGLQVIELDYSQQEYRMAGVYSQDPAILKAYKSGSDMHQMTADKMSLSRTDAKTLNFSVMYGAGRDRLVAVFGFSKKDASEMLNGFWKAYPKLAELNDTCEKVAYNRGWIKFWNGRKRHFQYPSEARKAMNSLIQGGCAQMLSHSIVLLSREKLSNLHLVGQVHDSLWIEVKEGEADVRTKEVQAIMQDWAETKFEMPFPTDVKRLA